MEHFNGILFHKIGPANKQHANQSINQIQHNVSWIRSISIPPSLYQVESANTDSNLCVQTLKAIIHFLKDSLIHRCICRHPAELFVLTSNLTSAFVPYG